MRAIFVVLLLFSTVLQAIPLVDAGTPASVTVSSDNDSVSVDGAIQFTAEVRDSNGALLDDDVIWSASNGTITSDGMFTGWNQGSVTIKATIGSINGTKIIQVNTGWAMKIISEIVISELAIDSSLQLLAHLADRAGNEIDGEVTWRVSSGTYDSATGMWMPSVIGSSELVATWFELETIVTMNIVAGAPSQLLFLEDLITQSGTHLQIDPILVDSLGNTMDISLAGQLFWDVEDGSISSSGDYIASQPGRWNLSINSSSGANGSTTVKVLPGPAVGLSIDVGNQTIRAGVPIVLVAIREDTLGNFAPLDLSISNWTVSTGSLAILGNDIIWTPSSIGLSVIAVEDQGFSETVNVEVDYGPAASIDLDFSRSINSGESIMTSLVIMDKAGNSRTVNGSWDVDAGLNADIFTEWVVIKPKEIGLFNISATWFDNDSGSSMHIKEQVEVIHGALAKIRIIEGGTKVASDDTIDLSPTFEDQNGNHILSMPVNWTIDGEVKTMEMRLANFSWAPTELGVHEIRVMADGIYAVVEIEVIPGVPRHIQTNFDSGIVVSSGSSVTFSISALDVHGNAAPADDIEFFLSDPLGEVTASANGTGMWDLKGGSAGEWELRISEASASHSIPVTVTPGTIVRLVANLPDKTPDQGEKMIITVIALDSAENEVQLDSSQIIVACSAGKVSNLGNSTWELLIEESGTDHACTVKMNNLVAQRFFDVDAVLLGGSLGDTDAALSIIMLIMLLLVGVMMVIVRRLNNANETEIWDENNPAAKDYGDVVEITDGQPNPQIPHGNDTQAVQHGRVSPSRRRPSRSQLKARGERKSKGKGSRKVGRRPAASANIQVQSYDSTPYQAVVPTQGYESQEDMRHRLAAVAKQTGVMQAAPGTEQGKTGWYIDIDGHLSGWRVDPDGSWNKSE